MALWALRAIADQSIAVEAEPLEEEEPGPSPASIPLDAKTWQSIMQDAVDKDLSVVGIDVKTACAIHGIPLRGDGVTICRSAAGNGSNYQVDNSHFTSYLVGLHKESMATSEGLRIAASRRHYEKRAASHGDSIPLQHVPRIPYAITNPPAKEETDERPE